MNLNYKIKVETAPIQVISIGENIEIKLYWTANRGTYDYQIVTEVRDHEREIYEANKTNGCGYLKQQHGLEWALRLLKIKSIKKYSNGASDMYNYSIGGNYYKVPISHVKFEA